MRLSPKTAGALQPYSQITDVDLKEKTGIRDKPTWIDLSLSKTSFAARAPIMVIQISKRPTRLCTQTTVPELSAQLKVAPTEQLPYVSWMETAVP